MENDLLNVKLKRKTSKNLIKKLNKIEKILISKENIRISHEPSKVVICSSLDSQRK